MIDNEEHLTDEHSDIDEEDDADDSDGSNDDGGDGSDYDDDDDGGDMLSNTLGDNEEKTTGFSSFSTSKIEDEIEKGAAVKHQLSKFNFYFSMKTFYIIPCHKSYSQYFI